MSHLAHEKTVLPQGTDNQSQKGEKEDTVEKPTSKDPHMEVLRPYPQLVVVKLTTPHRQTAMSTMLGGRSIIGPFVNKDADEEIRMVSGRLVIMPEDGDGSFELSTKSRYSESDSDNDSDNDMILAGTSYLLAAPFGSAQFYSTFTEPDEDDEAEATGGEDGDEGGADGEPEAEGGEDEAPGGEDKATDGEAEGTGDEDGGAGDEDEATPPAEMLPPPESVSTVREPIFPRSPIGGAIVKSTKLPPSDTKPNE